VRKTTAKAACPRCKGTDLFDDHPVQALVCLDCGNVSFTLTGASLAAFREEIRPARGGRKH
jgi:transcription initiation factor TFIIIB Brf1 subunit/transcription initiation factor TFIIB